jgi:excisionase family DNA binding protein
MDDFLRQFVHRVIVPALMERLKESPERIVSEATRWLTVKQASARAQCGANMLYPEVRAGRLRAARVGGKRSLRFRAEWVDEWLRASSSLR